MDDNEGLGPIGTDPDVFEAFYREHVEDVQRFVARRVDDPHLAADLTADVFLAVITAADSYRTELGAPRAWLFGVARNVVSMENRRRARQSRALGRLHGQRVLEPDAVEHALDRMDAEREARALHGRLETLTPRLRAVVELVYVDQLSVTDAAAALGISPGSARVRLHRARRHLGDACPATHPLTCSTEALS